VREKKNLELTFASTPGKPIESRLKKPINLGLGALFETYFFGRLRSL